MTNLIIFGAKYLYLVIILIAFVYFLRQPKNLQKNILTFAVISLPLIYLTAIVIGHFYFDPRPFVVNHAIPLIPHAPDNGFPSDHTLLTAAIAVIIYPYNKKIGWLLGILAAIVGMSRVYANIHHPIDVIGSMIIAITIGYLTYNFLLKKKMPGVI